jgi:hypothetical protein
VWEQTVGRLRQFECPFAILPSWYDVDELDDLLVLREELTESSGRDHALCELLQRVEKVLSELEPEPE